MLEKVLYRRGEGISDDQRVTALIAGCFMLAVLLYISASAIGALPLWARFVCQ